MKTTCILVPCDVPGGGAPSCFWVRTSQSMGLPSAPAVARILPFGLIEEAELAVVPDAGDGAVVRGDGDGAPASPQCQWMPLTLQL